jgi:hypothetical protein
VCAALARTSTAIVQNALVARPALLTYFVLPPRALPWPDGGGMTVLGAAENEVPPYALRSDEPPIGPADRWWVQLIFHQRTTETDRDDRAFALVDQVMRESGGLPALQRKVSMPAFSPDDHRETVVEITTPLAGDDPDHLREAINLGLDALRDAHRAMILAADAFQTPLAAADVWPVIPCVRRNPATGTTLGPPQLVVLEPNDLRDAPAPEELDADGRERVEAALGAMQARHPFLRWREWLLAAEEARIATRPENAVVRLAVAVEVLLDSVLALALWETGTPVGAGSEVLGKDLARRVRQHFGAMLGGGWDRSREPVASWSRDLVFLRGRILHRGHRPGASDVEAAFAAADALHRYVVSRVLARRTQIPRTALLLIGRAELERVNALDGAVRRAVATMDDEDWLLDYDHWRAEVDSLIAER